MNNNFKSKSFSFVFWIMIFFLIGDTLDTAYRFISGYLGGGGSFPGADYVIKPTTLDLVVFLFVQVGLICGIYLLYNLKRFGGYLFFFSQLIFLIYASFFGPISKIGITEVLLPLMLFFIVYFFFAIAVPWFYWDNFE